MIKLFQDTRIINIVAFSTITITLALNLYLVYLMLIPVNIIEIEQPMNIVNENNIVNPGEIVKYEVNYCKFIDVNAQVSRTVVSADTINNPPVGYPTNLFSAPTGCDSFTSTSVTLPDDIPPGNYIVSTNIEYRPNPLRTETYNAVSEVFTVAQQD